MRCILLLFIMTTLLYQAGAQIPRSNAGIFEYTSIVTGHDSLQMKQKARNFFNQPFLVHWDSVARTEHNGSTLLTGTGYITVRAKHHSVSLPTEVPVSLQFSIEVKGNHYRYTVNQFKVDDQETSLKFALEEKPDSVKSIVYDQLLQRTHKRMTYVIGWMKRYMGGEL